MAQLCHEGADIRRCPLHLCARCAGWVVPQACPVAVRFCRAYGAWNEAAAAVGADVVKNALHTISAEGAFIGADARISAGRSKITVAHLAVGSEF